MFARISSRSWRTRGGVRAEDRALFGVYLSILDDSTLGGEVVALIKGESGPRVHSARSCCATYGILSVWSTYSGAGSGCEIWGLVCWGLQDADRGDVDYPERTVLGRGTDRSALGEIPRDKRWVLCRCAAAQTAIRQYWQERWASLQLLAWRTCL